jgi:predicted nucleic acid-binding protein
LRKILLDAGVFLLYERGRQNVVAALEDVRGKDLLVIAAHTFAEFYRGNQRSAKTSNLARILQLDVLAITRETGMLAGEMLGRVGGKDSMDALVVAAAVLNGIDEIFTGDPDDLTRLSAGLGSNHQSPAIVDIN